MKLDDGSLKLHSLLTLIVLNAYDLLTLKPWGEKEEAIAIGACIDALPLTKGYRCMACVSAKNVDFQDFCYRSGGYGRSKKSLLRSSKFFARNSVARHLGSTLSLIHI